jgi:hypothetical protein
MKKQLCRGEHFVSLVILKNNDDVPARKFSVVFAVHRIASECESCRGPIHRIRGLKQIQQSFVTTVAVHALPDH